MWHMNDVFYDDEDIVAKIQYLQELTTKDPYVGWHGQASKYIRRVEAAIDNLPREYQDAALALFASVIYLPRDLLEEAWREIVFRLISVNNWSPQSGFRDSFFLAVDNAGLITSFSHVASLSGREDHDVNPGYGTVSELIDNMVAYVKGGFEQGAIIKDLALVKQKKWWILLTDNAISGGSARSDIEKLSDIKKILFGDEVFDVQFVPKTVLCAQLITEQAIKEIKEILPPTNILYGLLFDDRFRINSERCALYKEKNTLTKVRTFCEWFGNVFFVENPDERFRERLKTHIKKGGSANYAYGWRNSGYTIVTQENCLSNSVPPLYYTPSLQISEDQAEYLDYKPPFPRLESRETHQTSNDRENINFLMKPDNLKAIREGLRRNERQL